MAVSPMMDRYTTSVGMSQINFIEFVVSPLYWLTIQMLPELTPLMRNLIENRLEYGKVFDLEICSQVRDWLPLRVYALCPHVIGSRSGNMLSTLTGFWLPLRGYMLSTLT
eukprot:2127783-Pyramimonas_sp.AAC.1